MGGKMSEGWVYILSNASMKGMVKIGFSTAGADFRAKDLFTTGVPTPFKIQYEVRVLNCKELEKLVHQRLKKYRVAANREFFKIDVPAAISLVQECVGARGRDEEVRFKTTEQIIEEKEKREISKLKREEQVKKKQLVRDYENHVSNYINFFDSCFRETIFEICRDYEKKILKQTMVFSKKRKSGLQIGVNFRQDFNYIHPVFLKKFKNYLLKNPRFFEEYRGTRFQFVHDGAQTRSTERLMSRLYVPPIFLRQNDIKYDFYVLRQEKNLLEPERHELINYYNEFLRRLKVKIRKDSKIFRSEEYCL